MLKSFGVALRRFEYVPGVRLTGKFKGRSFSSGYLHVFGEAGSNGTLRVRRGVLVGRLGGRRVRLRIPSGLPRIEQSATIEVSVGEGTRRSPLAAGSTPLPPSVGR